MQIKILKDCRWSLDGVRISSYFAGQVVEMDSKNAEGMIKHKYAESFLEEAKMMHTEIENKMMHLELEDKAAPTVRKNRKSKGVENE